MTIFYKSTVSEIAAGLSLSKQGGIFTGSNYIEHNLEGNEFESSELTIIVPFKPGFQANDNQFHSFFDFDGYPDGSFYLYKITNNSIVLSYKNKSGVAFNFTILYADYQAYWLYNQYNLITITIKTNSVIIKLNNNIVHNFSSSFTYNGRFHNELNIEIGSINHSLFFIGTIYYVKTFKRILSDQELTDIWNNLTYNYRNQATLDFPMTQRLHSGSSTYDVSRSQKVGTLVAGPTKLTDRAGYELNGSTQYITVPGSGVYNSSQTSMICKLGPNFNYTENVLRYIVDSSDPNKYLVFKNANAANNAIGVYFGNTSIFNVVDSAYSPYWNYRATNTLIATGDSAGNNSLYLNNKLIAQNSTTWTPKNPETIYIGCRYSIAYFFDGSIHSFTVIPKMITPLQVYDISQWSLSNDI